MNHDILLGVSLSLVLHGLLLWVGADLCSRPTQAMPLPAPLDLAIRTIPRDLEPPPVNHTIREAPPAVTPPHASPRFAAGSLSPPQKLLTEGVDKAMRARDEIPKKPLDQVMAPPRPIRKSTKPIEEPRVAGQAPKPQGMPPATQTPPARPDPRGHLSGIPSPLHRASEGLELGPSTEDEEGLPPVGADLREAVPDYAVNPEPVYPRLAIRRNYEGTVLLMVEVLRDGSVRDVRVLESSGHAILDRSALKAVRKWRFRPGTHGGQPVTMNVKVPVVFRLTREGQG